MYPLQAMDYRPNQSQSTNFLGQTLYPEQKKQFTPVFAFIAILFILASFLIILKFQAGVNSNLSNKEVQGISTQTQDIYAVTKNAKH